MVKKEKSKKTKIAVILFLITAILATAITSVLAFGETKEGYRNITVIEIQGTVGVVHNNIEYAAYTGMHLEEGYSVVTGGNSYIRLLLDDDKYVKLEAGAKAVFEEVSGGKTAINIERGSLVAEVTKPLQVDEDFIVNTPNAILAVRGTLFRVDLSRNDKGELNTDVMTYGGAVSSKRVQPSGEVEDIEVTIKEGFKATVNMDEKETVYLVDEVKVDLSALVGTPSGDNKPGDTTIIETNPDGEIIESTPITLESVLKPIVVTDIPDDDLVDIYFASNNGHSMFIETKEIEEKIIERDIDVTQKTSVYEVAEKVENPVEIVIPDDNVPLATTTEVVEEQKVVAVQGPPTDGLGTETTHTHTVVTEEIKPTCLKDGKTITKCSVCEEIIEEKIIKATGHTEKTVTVSATCTANGKTTVTCSICNALISETVIASKGHTEKKMVANPTCTYDGSTLVNCSVCGLKLSETVEKATGHTKETITVEPTCIKNGSKTTKCAVCGEVFETVVLEKLGHTIETTTVNATCTEDGKITEICVICNEVVSEIVVDASGHTAETTKVSPTCTEDGSETTVCTVCDEELYYTILEKTGHTEETETVEPTCTTAGSKTIKCSVCDEILSTEALEKLGHTENATTIEPTCTADGKTTVTCTVCSEVLSENVLTATGHTEVFAGNDAVHIKCSVCDLPLVTEHDMQQTINQKENCTQEGSYTYNCECGYEYSETVPALGHTEVNAGEADVHTKCNVCGVPLTDGTAHNYTDTVTKLNSCTAEGILTHTCSCGWGYTEPIPASHTKSTDGLTCSACGGAWVDLNSTNFPDSNFLYYISANYNNDPYVTDEALIGDELTGVVTINVAGDSTTDGGYTDLTGIKHFSNLVNVNCAYNGGIESLDLSGLTSLTNLDVTGLTSLKTLNISGCINLTDENIIGLDTCTELTTLNVSGCVNLAELNVNSNTKLQTVDLSNCSAITSFTMADQTKAYSYFSSIDLTGCSKLETLKLNSAGSLESIDFTDLTAIKTIDIGGCQAITGTLDVSNKSNLKTLTIGALNKVTSLNVSGCTALTEINALACSKLATIVGIKDCSAITTLMLKGTAITSLDLNSTNSELQSLSVENCTSLTNLDLMRSTESTTFNSLTVTGCTSLKTLNLYNCKGITTLDTTTLTALETLNLTYSGVSTFNSATDTMSFTQNVNLKNLYLNGVNSFAGFDISANTLLEAFGLTENTSVTSLDFSNNTKLKTLNLSDVSSLNTLNVSSCTVLESVNVLNTGLTALSVTGSDLLTQFWVYDNTNLTSLSLTGATSLTSVKLSAGMENTALTSLAITNCGIDSLDVTYLKSLTSLDVSNCTGLSGITGIENLTNLQTLFIDGSGIKNIDISASVQLTTLGTTNCTSLNTINISNTKVSNFSIDDTLTSLVSVTLNNVDSSTGRFSINNNTVETVSAQNINVQSFGVTSTSVSSIDLANATIGDGGMMSFSISNCGSSLETLIVSGSNLTTLPTETMSALKNFKAESCTGIYGVDFAVIPNIETFDISGCSNIVTLNFSNCTTLKTVDVSNTGVTSLDFSSNLSLISLDASGCTGLTTLELGNNAVITDLYLSDCTNLDFDFGAYSSLVNVNMSGTAVTVVDASQCPYLKTIDFSNCTSFEAFAMSSGDGSIRYDQLETAIFAGCTKLEMLQIDDSATLSIVDLTGAEEMNELWLRNCTNITSLDLSDCINITQINVTGSSLVSGSITLPAGKDESIIDGLS